MGDLHRGRVFTYMNGVSNDDTHLLRRYAQEGSETAFRELVERHIPLVNATARRLAGGNTHLADDVTQVVFTDLARKAATLPEGMLLSGWLHRHTCYTALKTLRSENRRRARERTAMETNLLNEDSARDEQWARLAPVLDEALDQLGEEDRVAIVLRYLEQRDVRSVGVSLGTTETAAQKRLGRALEKLRGMLTRRGVTVSTALLATALDAGAANAPMSHGLAATVSAAALSKATGGTVFTSLLALLYNAMTSKPALGLTAVIALIATLHVFSQSGCQSTVSSTVTPTPASAQAAPEKANRAKMIAPTAAAASVGTTASATANPPVIDPELLDLLAPKPGKPGPTYNMNPIINSQDVWLTFKGGIVFLGKLNFPQQEMRTHPMDEIMKTSNFVRQTPLSSVVNGDGSTTDTYKGPSGETIRVVKSADGKNDVTQVGMAPFNRAPR